MEGGAQPTDAEMADAGGQPPQPVPSQGQESIQATLSHGGRFIQYNIFGNIFEVTSKYKPPIMPIGKGAYGIVAIKKIANAFDNKIDAKRTLREIKLLRHMDHENVTREIQPIGFSIFLSGKFLPLAWVFCVLPIIILFKSTSSEFTEEFLQSVFYAGLRGFESCIYCIIHSHCINNVVFGVAVKEVGTYGSEGWLKRKMVAVLKATVESQWEAARRGRKGIVAVDSCVAARGRVGNHDNVAGRGRRGQQQGDVGEGDLGGRGGKGNGGKQGQRLGKQRPRDNDGRHRSTAVAGKPWQFHYSYWSNSQSYVLTKGWSCFVKEKLDAGDVILFERQGGEEGPSGNRGGSGCVAPTRATTRAVSRRRQQRGEEDGPAKGPRWQRAGSRRQHQRGEERKKG
ncbi:hypothetical protein BHM03_00002362 [Ensete ventricosum]|nr:hypothetical protein BHM03_00002362 [Ensete ventricosum]